MRCPQCGTQNEPDSRFCGGCGARAAGGENRLAPTEKIHSDAPMQVQPLSSISPEAGVPPPRRVSAPPEMPTTPTPLPGPRPDVAGIPHSIPPANNGQWSATPPSYNGSGVPMPSVAPQSSGGAVRHQGTGPATSIPSHNGTGPATSIPPQNVPAGSSRSPKRSASSEVDASIRPARTRWGLIIFLLLFDAGLATAGTWMLLEGLADPPTVTAPTKSGARDGSPTAADGRTGSLPPPPTPVRVADVTDAPPAPATPTPTPPTPTPPPPADDTKASTPTAITPTETTPTEQPVEQKPLDATPPLDAKPGPEKPVDKKPTTEPPVDPKPTKKSGEKKPRKKPKDDSGKGPEDPYGDPLPPETE